MERQPSESIRADHSPSLHGAIEEAAGASSAARVRSFPYIVEAGA